MVIEKKRENQHKRRNSVDSPYFGDKKKPQANGDNATNPHIHSLFGNSEKRSSPTEPRETNQQQQQREQREQRETQQGDSVFREIIDSPMKRYNSHSVHNLDEPRPNYDQSPLYSNDDELDSDLRQGLEKMIDSDDI